MVQPNTVEQGEMEWERIAALAQIHATIRRQRARRARILARAKLALAFVAGIAPVLALVLS